MSDSGLKRQIGLVTAAAVVVGEVVGVGIFLTPAAMAKTLGSPLLLLSVWLASGLMALSGALCYGELAARFPAAGGGYVYLRDARRLPRPERRAAQPARGGQPPTGVLRRRGGGGGAAGLLSCLPQEEGVER